MMVIVTGRKGVLESRSRERVFAASIFALIPPNLLAVSPS
jgi:hypothetical protein